MTLQLSPCYRFLKPRNWANLADRYLKKWRDISWPKEMTNKTHRSVGYNSYHYTWSLGPPIPLPPPLKFNFVCPLKKWWERKMIAVCPFGKRLNFQGKELLNFGRVTGCWAHCAGFYQGRYHVWRIWEAQLLAPRAIGRSIPRVACDTRQLGDTDSYPPGD